MHDKNNDTSLGIIFLMEISFFFLVYCQVPYLETKVYDGVILQK